VNEPPLEEFPVERGAEMKTRLWVFGLPKDRGRALKFLRDAGYEAVTVGRDEEAVDAIAREGLKAHIVLGTFSVGRRNLQGEEFLARRLDGVPVKWFGSGCPNNPQVRAVSLDLVREAASMEGVEAIILDGIRFASPGEGVESFMTCFCKECERKAYELGYDVSRMKRSLRELLKAVGGLTSSILRSITGWRSPIDLLDLLMRYPGVLEWLRFRADCVVEHVEDVRKVLKSVNPSCRLGAYLFSPSLSYLVGQDYRSLAELLDYVEPMIYRVCGGVACLNFEVARMAFDIYKRGSNLDQVDVQRFIFNLLGLDSEPKETIEELKEGLSSRVIESETRRALNIAGTSKTVPILYLDDPLLKESVEGALRAGARGLSFFKFSEGSEGALKAVSELVKERE